jgi:uncharacterized membrane protein
LLGTIAQIVTDALIKVFHFPELVTVLISVLPIVEARGAIPIAFGYGIRPPLALLYAFIGSSLMAPLLIAVLLPFVRWLSRTKLFRKVGQTLYDKFEKKSQTILKDADAANISTVESTPNHVISTVATDANHVISTVESSPNHVISTVATEGSEAEKSLSAEKSESLDCARADRIAENASPAWPPARKKRLSPDMRKMLGVFAFVAIPLPLTGVWTGSAVAACTKLPYPKALLAVVAGNLVATSLITLLCVLLPAKVIDYVILAVGLIAIAVVIALIVKIILHKPDKNNGQIDKEENK